MLLAAGLLALALLQGGRVRPPVAARAVRAAVAPRLAAATGIEQIEQLSVALEAGTPAVDAVPQLFPFPLDEFQLASLRALEAERSVVVSAPTGSGKTVIAELAIYLGLARGGRIVYTTPLKALSNQKYQDLQRRFGRERVGLMTGDACLNAEAEVLVMTTEVFRNMLLEDDQVSVGGGGAGVGV
jgi:superfamily II RNA helicase